MITAADRAKYALPVKPTGPRSFIEKADELVDIRDVLKQMGIWAPTGDFGSYKMFCPWDYEHADGGIDKNCRIYGTNNIYCFAQHGRITPTSLYARWKGIPRVRAAGILLDARGLLNKSWREQWNELVILREDKVHVKLGSQNDLVSALHMALEADEEYTQNEFTTEVREAWHNVLEVLDALWEHPDTNLTVLEQWFDRSLTKLLASARIR